MVADAWEKLRRQDSVMRRIRPFVFLLLPLVLSVRAAELSTALSDEEFWRIITDFSETGGVFQPQLMTNEDSLQSVIPALKQRTQNGGAYIGVGTEQNFTYITTIR